MSINEKFLQRGERLKSERKRLKLTQPVMGELIGVEVGSVVRYEKKGDPLNQNQLEQLNEAGFDVYFILFGLRATELTEDEHKIISAYRCLKDDATKTGFVGMANAYATQSNALS